MDFEHRRTQILELGFSEKELSPLQIYIDKLWQANQSLNLFSRQMLYEELIDNHLIDSLLPLKYFPRHVRTVADFGTGGGLPAVVYAIQFPNIKFHLYEKSIKKQNFLNGLRDLVPNLVVLGEITQNLGEVELVMARAFKPVDVILDMSRSFLESGGSYFLFKGRRERIDEELAIASKKFKNLNVAVTELKSPVMPVERNLVVISKR